MAPKNQHQPSSAVMEAMVCGCPLIVSDVLEHRAFLAEDSTLFVPAEDHAANKHDLN
jgi:hypothetical protein